MTTAHRPTFDPARGKDAQRGPAYHQRLLPAHKTLKFRQATQGTTSEHSQRDLRAELLRAERRHYAKKEGRDLTPSDDEAEPPEPRARAAIEGAVSEPGNSADADPRGVKRTLSQETPTNEKAEEEEDYETKRRRVLEETRAIDAESSGSDANASDSDSSSDESDDDEAELMRELAKIKAERAEAAAKEAAAAAAKEEEEREFNIARGNPLLNPADYGVKRRWDDDVVFRNQARGTGDREKGKGKEFVNDLLRSDFHRRFMSKYVR
ncbi:hypothetical protein MBLNU457_6591t1 [Dothideomycetes sp. NU457]